MSALTSLVVGVIGGLLLGLCIPFAQPSMRAERAESRLAEANAVAESCESQLKERSRQIATQAGQLLRVRTELAALRKSGDIVDALSGAPR